MYIFCPVHFVHFLSGNSVARGSSADWDYDRDFDQNKHEFFINLWTKCQLNEGKTQHLKKMKKIWIISQYHRGYSSIQVKRNFQKEFGETIKNRKLKPDQFKRVFERFNKTGISCIGNQNGGPKSFFLVTWQKMYTFRKSEKKNLRKLVHGAPSCTTFKKSTCNLNTLYLEDM